MLTICDAVGDFAAIGLWRVITCPTLPTPPHGTKLGCHWNNATLLLICTLNPETLHSKFTPYSGSSMIPFLNIQRLMQLKPLKGSSFRRVELGTRCTITEGGTDGYKDREKVIEFALKIFAVPNAELHMWLEIQREIEVGEHELVRVQVIYHWHVVP
ncbi:hypothetical protein pdam_00018167 [Pocillopora damicornis]|uniref:Uncharacterized protein n=1 Tax=Pocillopora damicornis TaxID=46731 RepID=A0A3M6UZH1_POCDA|nr:hypothetical protein pdam_00018167 [Pocillopora damicornis]